MGTAAYNERMRRHYETFVSEDDFRRMAQIGLNAVRLPVPWYAFGSQESDASYISVVDYIDRAIEWAAKYNIRVLLDLATVPGGRGDSNDSPATPEAVAEWHSSTNGRHVALDVLERLAERYGEAESLLGIELLDTPQMSVRKSLFAMTDGIPAHYLRNFYRDAYELVRSYMPEDKIVVFFVFGASQRVEAFYARRQVQERLHGPSPVPLPRRVCARYHEPPRADDGDFP